ncbi:squalene epoxidase 3-like isoform X2 [Nicotiana sylvestris]|uniref:Squalene monooxygenase n=1 Tax=Nicotiana sylvestris TaxID=4096 RepID=A0A1U7WI18_NICSY|nr:PREDICTED: squalene monooxygenase-like isoform X2 [Nicotiana sylvestris]
MELVILFIASLFGLLLLYNMIRRKIMEIRNITSNVVVMKDHKSYGNTDVIIVGAGVAGSALACTLGKDGRRVHVIERDLTEPDRMVGELLQPGGYLKLVELGLEDCLEDIDAQRVGGHVLYKKNGEHIMLSYPLEKFQAVDASGRCFHNGRFVQKMREKAATLPNVRLEKGTVTSLIEEKGSVKGVNYKTKDGRELTAYAPLTIVCDGCFSNLRRSLCNPKVPSELRDALIRAIGEENNIRRMQFRSMAANTCTIPGSLLIGDAFNMRHPLSAGGMTVALSDIVVLRHLLKPLPNFTDANAVLQRFYTLRKPVASTINILAGVTYQVFSPSLDPSRKEIREAFYGYLRLGGIFTNGAIGLLAGLNPTPLGFAFQFIAVAVYTFGRLLLPFPTPNAILRGARLLYVAIDMIFPIIKAEGIRQMFFPASLPAYYSAPALAHKSDQ